MRYILSIILAILILPLATAVSCNPNCNVTSLSSGVTEFIMSPATKITINATADTSVNVRINATTFGTTPTSIWNGSVVNSKVFEGYRFTISSFDNVSYARVDTNAPYLDLNSILSFTLAWHTYQSSWQIFGSTSADLQSNDMSIVLAGYSPVVQVTNGSFICNLTCNPVNYSINASLINVTCPTVVCPTNISVSNVTCPVCPACSPTLTPTSCVCPTLNMSQVDMTGLNMSCPEYNYTYFGTLRNEILGGLEDQNITLNNNSTNSTGIFDSDFPFTMLISIIGLVVVIFGGAVAYYVLVVKKKKVEGKDVQKEDLHPNQ